MPNWTCPKVFVPPTICVAEPAAKRISHCKLVNRTPFNPGLMLLRPSQTTNWLLAGKLAIIFSEPEAGFPWASLPESSERDWKAAPNQLDHRLVMVPLG